MVSKIMSQYSWRSVQIFRGRNASLTRQVFQQRSISSVSKPRQQHDNSQNLSRPVMDPIPTLRQVSVTSFVTTCVLILFAASRYDSETAATEGVVANEDSSKSNQVKRIKGIRFMKGQGDRTNRISSTPQCCSVSTFATQGPRPAMEDEYFCSFDGCFFGVYDGHGGPRVSALIKQNLYEYFSSTFFSNETEGATTESPIAAALSGAFQRISRMVLKDRFCEFQGSTAVVVVLNEGEIWSGNVGDSRAVLSRDSKAVELTVDHKPNSDSERKRIEALGGKVKWHGYRGPDRQPIPGMGAYRINGNMAVSRAIGDKRERPFVSSDAEISRFERDAANDQFIILASDGLWDVMTSQEAVSFVTEIMSGSVGALREGTATDQLPGVRPVTKRLSQWMKGYAKDTGMIRAVVENRKQKMARYLVEESIRRGTSDNVTVIVVWLR